MKKQLVTALVMGVVLTGVTAMAQGTGGNPQGDQIQQRDQDRLQTCSPALDQDRTRARLKDCLPVCVQDAVKEMKQTREQYQQQLRDQIKDQKACTAQDCDQLRQQLGGTVILDSVAKQALLTALAGPEGEYAARATYAAILAKFGEVQPYANIYQAEVKHIAALQQQCVKYGVPIPADTYLGNVTTPATLLEAAATGVAAEILNVALYDDALSKVQKYPSLVQVFTNLRAASLNNHLPGFEAAVENGGTLP